MTRHVKRLIVDGVTTPEFHPMPTESRERCSECGRIKPGYRRDRALERRVFKLWSDGRSVRRIADELQISKSSVGRLLQQARA